MYILYSTTYIVHYTLYMFLYTNCLLNLQTYIYYTFDIIFCKNSTHECTCKI